MRSNRRALAYLLLVFVLGVAVGVLGSLWAERQGWAQTRWSSGHGSRPGTIEWLTRELNLTAEQQTQLQAILDETGAGYEAIRERTRPEYERVRQDGRAKIRALLTEEQRAKFEELVRRIDEERARRRQEQDRRKRSEAVK